MRRLTLALALLAALAALSFPTPVSAGGAVCCICSQCASGPFECQLPPNRPCDTACAEVGCPASTGGGTRCDMLEPCAAAAPMAVPAPIASSLGIAAVVTVLAALGIVQLSRRRA